MDGTPTPPPEASLIRLARQARGLNVGEAAAKTPIRIGKTRWGQIERGYEHKDKPVTAPASTLAHMANTVGVAPARLEEVGRADAAEILREIQRQQNPEAAKPPYADLANPHERVIWEMVGVNEETKRSMIDALRAGQEREQRIG